MVGQLTRGVGQVCTLVVYLVALFWMQWQLALASLVVIQFFCWAARHFADLTKSVSRERDDGPARSVRSPRNAWETPRSCSATA